MFGNESMKILELFAGSKSIGNAAKEFGHDVFSIDWKDYGGIDMIADIEFLQADSIDFIPDVVWASPDCATYSVAAIWRHRKGTEAVSEYAKKCDRVNLNFLKLIDEWQKQNPSLLYFIENPRGMMRKMPWMQKHKRHEIWYCQYGDSRAKPTDIWTNSNDWKPRQKCFNGNTNCHHEKVPRGSNKGTQGRSGSYERSKIPDELCKEIIESITNQKMLGAKGMKEKNNLTIVGMIENAYRMFGFLPDYLLASAKIAEKEHLKRAFENGAKSNGKTFDEFYHEFYESDEIHNHTERLAEMFAYADRYGYAKALKKFTDENKSREDQA